MDVPRCSFLILHVTQISFKDGRIYTLATICIESLDDAEKRVELLEG